MTLALVDKTALDKLIAETYSLRSDAGDEQDGPQGFTSYLHPLDPLVVLTVDAGLPLPGPMLEGTVPPPPPFYGRVTALTYRQHGDSRLRCFEDTKVVYTSMAQADAAASRISEREPMLAYQGDCGHYHVSRRKNR